MSGTPPYRGAGFKVQVQRDGEWETIAKGGNIEFSEAPEPREPRYHQFVGEFSVQIPSDQDAARLDMFFHALDAPVAGCECEHCTAARVEGAE